MFIPFDMIHERDRRTDAQTPHYGIGRAYAYHRTAKITLFRLHPARDPRSPPYLAWYIRGGPCHFCIPLTLFDRISIVSPLRAIEHLWGKCPRRGKMLITWLFVPESD